MSTYKIPVSVLVVVYTSDLHHVRTCRACKAKADAAKAAGQA